jgi:hypothetical protein
LDDKYVKEEYKLVTNPFNGSVAKKSDTRSWVDQDEAIKRWETLIKDIRTNADKNYLSIIIGDYGQGKTLSLFKIGEMLNAEKDNSILVTILNFKDEGNERSAGMDFLSRLIDGINLHSIRERLTTSRSKDKLQKSKVKEAISSIPIKFTDVKKLLTIIFFGNEQESYKALRFIKGEIHLTKKELKEWGVLDNVYSITYAKEYLIGVLSFLKALGINSVCFLIDEFEQLFSLVQKSKRPIYLALLRSLIDLPVGYNLEEEKLAKVCFFITISEGGYTELLKMEEADQYGSGPTKPLRRRIDSLVRLEPLNIKDTEKLIEMRLYYDRSGNTNSETDLIPYAKDFVRYVFEKTAGKPSSIVYICSQVLDAGSENKVKLIDKQFAEEVVKARNITF